MEDTRIRDSLAHERTVLANERTLLSYIRTALGFVALAVLAAKFSIGAMTLIIAALALIGALAVFLVGLYGYRNTIERIGDRTAILKPIATFSNFVREGQRRL